MKQGQIYFTFFLCCMFFVTSTHAQGQTTISGTVIDAESNESMPGVNILVKGTTTGTSTDSEGNFELTVPSLSDTLVVSFIGYQTNEVPINGRTDVRITLQSQTVAGDELVVTAFGLEREEKSLTYSTQDVSTEQIVQARELNVVNSLSGKVAGISITQGGGGVGSSSRVLLRGNRSISGSSQPLYVVDGVPVRGSISNINPDIIASINVLKGANAAALYGSSAQNGVIIVTTKKGKADQANISLGSTFMVRDPVFFTEFQNIYGQGSGGQYSANSEQSWGPRMEGQMVDHWSLVADKAGTQYSFLPQPGNNTRIFQRGYNLSNNFTASIGGEKTQVLFSFTNTNSRGVIPNNQLNKNNVSVRANTQVTSRLALDTKVSYIQQAVDDELLQGQQTGNPVRQVYRMPRNIRAQDVQEYTYTTPDGQVLQNSWNPGSYGASNPYWSIYRNLNETSQERVIAMAKLNYDFTDALSMMVRGAYDGESGSYERKLYNGNYIEGQNGYYETSKSNASELYGDFLLSYKQDVSEDWYFDVNFGGSIKKERNTSLSSNTGLFEELYVPNFFTLSNTEVVHSSYNIGSPRDVQSLYSFAQIGWRNSVFLDITGRNDWSSTLPADSWSYFYPSVGVSAVLSDLMPAFFPEYFTFAKVRASWAKVGSSAAPFLTQRFANFSPGGANGFVQLSSTLPNEDLKPEQTESFEVGLDLRFLEGRLGLDVTAYKTNTYNQLFSLALPVGSGASEFYTNGGDIQNRGVEVLLTTTPVQTSDLSWNVDINFAANRNKVNEIYDNRPVLTLSDGEFRAFRIEEGEPFGELYSRGYVRDDQGRVIVDSNGMPQITNGKSVRVANFTPDWVGGLSSSISYKNISLSFLIDHRQGGSLIAVTQAFMTADGVTKRTLAGREGGLVFGKNLFPEETAVLADGSPNNIEIDAETFWKGVGGRIAPVGEAFVESATNMRLRELIIGYSLPQSVLANLPISNLRFSLVGRNLFFFYRAADLDPDIMLGTNVLGVGKSSFAPPTARTFGANIEITF